MGSHLHIQAPRALLHNHASRLCGSFGSLHTMSQCHKYGTSPDPMTMLAMIGCMLVLAHMLS